MWYLDGASLAPYSLLIRCSNAEQGFVRNDAVRNAPCSVYWSALRSLVKVVFIVEYPKLKLETQHRSIRYSQALMHAGFER